MKNELYYGDNLDVLRHGSLLAHLVHMTQRIVEIHRVLKPTGSFYLHCDPTASHYLKLVLDAVFCGQGGDFLNEIVWKRTTAHSDTAEILQGKRLDLPMARADAVKAAAAAGDADKQERLL